MASQGVQNPPDWHPILSLHGARKGAFRLQGFDVWYEPKPYIPYTTMAKLRPRPGSLPLLKHEAHTASEYDEIKPPWKGGNPEEFRAELARRERLENSSALQQARAKVEELSGKLRSAAFDDWVRRCLVEAQAPGEWTKARCLYDSYIAHAQHFGDNRNQRSQSVLALATETQWGRMMATLFIKKRRTSGWFYPLRVKRGA